MVDVESFDEVILDVPSGACPECGGTGYSVVDDGADTYPCTICAGTGNADVSQRDA
jgi:DnaJ-class molecular chaperone